MYKTYVPPSGNMDAKLAIVGEQPGFQEIRERKPFVGPAGKGLDECLTMTKIPRHEIYLTNVIKDLDAPLKHYIDLDTRGKYKISEEGWQYIEKLKDELRSLKNLNCAVATGNVPLLALCSRVGISKWRGSVIESTLIPGLKVVPTFHSATFIPPKFNFLNKPLICEDLLRANHEAKFKEIKRLERRLTIKPSFQESLNFLEYSYEVGMRGQTLGIDIEVINGEVDCFSISWSPTEAICIPFRGSQGDYFTPDQEYEIMLLLAKIVQEERISKVGANFIFDLQFLFHKYGIHPKGTFHCTQIAQKISYPDFPAGLDFVTNMYTDVPYYKQDGKQWMKMQTGTWEEWWNYNAMDAVIPVEAIPKQLQVLRKQQNAETYERQRRLIEPLIYMSERGIKVDVQGMMDYKDQQQQELDQLAEKLNAEVGREINYNSTKQLKEFFYEELGIKPYKKRNAKGQYNVSVDVDALKRIYRQNSKGSEAARILLDIRSLTKRISTYLNIGKVDKDGRYRSSYKPVGAETGRLSSGETIFGTGGNQQNWPHDLLRFFLFDEGYIGYSIDLSQIENRIVAYVGGVIPQIKAFEQGIDLHRMTASIIFNKPYNQISNKDGSSTLGDGRQSERYWGKKCVLETAQVLTPHGWMLIETAKHYNFPIAQWNEDGTISFAIPTQWYEDIYTGNIITIENQRIFQEATPDHKMPLYYNNEVISKRLSDYPKSGKYRAPLSGTYNGNIDLPNPIVRLLVAFQADGHWNYNAIAFKLQKERKIARLKAILELADIQYSDNPSGIYISAKHNFCKYAYTLLGHHKIFGEWLLNLSTQALEAFIDELPHWDGYIRYEDENKKLYFTTVKQNAIWAQTIAHLVNKAANITEQDNKNSDSFGNKTLYRVSIRNSTAPATSAIKRSSRFVRNEKIFCPTVPSGYFLVKENNKISVTGNSNHAINYDVGYKRFALTNEMTEAEAKYVLEKVHKGYPQIRDGYQKTIQNMLKRDRMVVNLFGRRRLFLGPIIPSHPNVPKSACEATFRDAYAHFAQSSCADKINEQGLEFVYYNQNIFRSVELLAQVHDSIVFQIPLSIPWEEHAKMLLMIKDSLETPLVWHEQEIKTPCDLSIGFNMCKENMKELKSKEIPSDVNLFANKLKEICNDLRGD